MPSRLLSSACLVRMNHYMIYIWQDYKYLWTIDLMLALYRCSSPRHSLHRLVCMSDLLQELFHGRERADRHCIPQHCESWHLQQHTNRVSIVIAPTVPLLSYPVFQSPGDRSSRRAVHRRGAGHDAGGHRCFVAVSRLLPLPLHCTSSYSLHWATS